MKKYFFIACISLMAISQISAQRRRVTRFGAKAGLNISVFRGGSPFDYFAKPGFHLGGALEVPTRNKKIFLQPELLFSLQGSGGSFQDKLNFWYLNIPILVKYEVWDDLYVEAGPQGSLLLANNIDANSFGTTQVFDTTNSIDYGVVFGAGYRLDEELYFQIRFNLGLVNAIEDLPSKNSVFQLSIVYFIR